MDSGFNLPEILLLWKLSLKSGLSEPITLFWSQQSLKTCISKIIEEAKKNGTENTPTIQSFLSKLYAFQTKNEITSSQKKGITSSRYLETGQKIVIILPKKGVFISRIVNNGHELTVKLPVIRNGIYRPEGTTWNKALISIYLWRKNDANYVFDTKVLGSGVFMGESVLYLGQSNNLIRAQKRKSVRAECQIQANLFIITSKDSESDRLPSQGFRCLIEDISESGALIRIGGKGVAKIRIKLKFALDNEDIVMFGIVKAIEYNEKLNQSRLHFECFKLNSQMKNKILTFVYNILPQDEKFVLDALEQTSVDKEQEKQNEEEVISQNDNSSEPNNAENKIEELESADDQTLIDEDKNKDGIE